MSAARRPGEGALDRLIPARNRLLARVTKLANGCWKWGGFVTSQGYGACGYRRKRNVLAHRAVYMELVGPIPDGLTLDHLCHTRDHACQGGKTCPHRRCVNPDHQEPVPNAVNVSRGVFARRTHCPQGHPYAGDNLALTASGSRFCRTCSRDRARTQLAQQRAARPANRVRKPRARPTHCIRGHAFDAENTYIKPNGTHCCNECRRLRRQARRVDVAQPSRNGVDA